ncbi:heavy metal translocating P-type ATPase [Gemmatimonadota bacterium]
MMETNRRIDADGEGTSPSMRQGQAPERGESAGVAETPETAHTRLLRNVTVVVLAGMAAAMVLEWIPAEPSPWRWLPIALAYLVGGLPIVRETWSDLREGHLSIDFLMGTAALGALAVGRPLEGVILIFLFSLSNAMEAYAMGRTRSAIEALVGIRPESATLLTDEGERRIRIEDLHPGNRILVRPGERIAADGRVFEGRSEVDQAAITGESLPVVKEPGHETFAGTVNLSGALTIEVTKEPTETLLARIIELVREAQAARSPAQQFIDRFAHPYAVVVLIVTLTVWLVPHLIFDVPWYDAFYRAITLLVVASPCALVISTPSAVLSAIANGARHGILYKGGAYLDLAGTIDTVAFDKTGTLTLGRATLYDLTAEGDVESEEEVLRLAASVERPSEHHLARAIVLAAASRGLELSPVADFGYEAGRGVSGKIDGRIVWAGNLEFLKSRGVVEPKSLAGWSAEQTVLGRTVVWVGRDEAVVGCLALGDAIRPRSVATVRHLKEEGIRWVVMLTGDHPEVAAIMAGQLGVDEVRAGLLPEQKVEAIRELVEGGFRVAMVGDGVNDAPAMALSTLGIAMGAAGTDVAIETADVVLMSDEIEKVDYVFHLGIQSRRIVRQNVWFSVGWMVLLVALTATVGIPLPLAVVGHEGSTLLVAANGLRLLASRPHPATVVPGLVGRGRVRR